jgi:ABC-type Fe3+-hydroxamate transport system substrate-binding protein
VRLGAILGAGERARSIASAIESARHALRRRAGPPFRYLYFVWRRPFLVAGQGTFIDALLGEAGGINCAPPERGRYPELAIEEVEATDADVLLLSSEPFPFREKHRSELAGRFPRERILLVDGELLSWHGVRMAEGLLYLGEIGKRVGALLGNEGKG